MPQRDLPTSVFDLTGSTWKGKLGVAPGETDFAPLVTEIIKAKGAAAAKSWLEGIKRNGKVYDGQRVADRGDRQGRGAGRHRRPLLLVPAARRGRRRQDPQRAALLRAGDPGAFVDVSGAAVLKSSTHQAAAQAFLAYLVSAPGADDHRHVAQLRVPAAPGRSVRDGPQAAGADRAVASPATLGDGKQALALLQYGGTALTRARRPRRATDRRPQPSLRRRWRAPTPAAPSMSAVVVLARRRRR